MKRLLLALGIVLVLAAAAAGGVWYTLSRFDARAEIVRRVSLATGRAFEIRGPVSVSLWPKIGFRGEDVALANAPGGASPFLLQAREISVGVALRPLLDRRLEISGVSLVEPKLALEVDANGRGNWILTPPASKAPAPAPTPAPAPSARVTEVSLSAASVENGSISYRNAKTGTAFDLSDVSLKTALKGLDQPLSFSGTATYRKEVVSLDVTVDKFRALIAGSVTPVTLKITAAPLNAAFTGKIDFKTGGLEGGVSADGPSLRTLAAWIGAPLGEGDTLLGFEIAGNVAVGPKRYSFENAKLKVDAVQARGDFLFEQSRATPLLSGRLEILDLDLNPYLAPAPRAGTVQIATLEAVDVTAPAGWSEATIDLAGLKRINANLDLTTGPLKFNKIKIDRTKMGLVLNDGYLAATMSDLVMYGGQGTGRFEVDARTPVAVIRNELAVQKINANAFFTDAIGFGGVEGVAKLDWGLASSGRTQKEMMSSLTGDGQVSFEQGSIKGVDLGGVARTIRNAMRRELVAPTARTKFAKLGAAFRAKDGVIATDSIALEAADARLDGIGTLDVARRSIDVRLVPRLGVMALAVPFRVNGPWDKMGYSSDILGRARADVETRARVVLGRAR